MREVEFVDTSILLNLLDVPGRNQHREAVLAELRKKVGRGVQLVLPVTTVIESGNHVLQTSDGRERRRCAEGFVKIIEQVAAGQAPWVLHEVAWDAGFLRQLCRGVRDCGTLVEVFTARTLSAGDLGILVERERFLARTAYRTVRIWTLDQRLTSFS